MEKENGITIEIMKHNLAVARKAKSIAEERFPEKKALQEEAFLLGYLHDIGKEFTFLDHEKKELSYYPIMAISIEKKLNITKSHEKIQRQCSWYYAQQICTVWEIK